VVEVLVNPGRVVGVGDIVVTLEVANRVNELEAVIYMPPNDGKKVRPGMEVKVSPSTVEVEVYGYIEGLVKHVSEYPASKAGMERVLGNTDLANAFSTGEPPIAVIVELLTDTATVSGYQWTSLEGPDDDIRSGTLCNAYITVETQRPISLLFPTIKKEMNLSTRRKNNGN
jgi:HlyD family secretion protein